MQAQDGFGSLLGVIYMVNQITKIQGVVNSLPGDMSGLLVVYWGLFVDIGKSSQV